MRLALTFTVNKQSTCMTDKSSFTTSLISIPDIMIVTDQEYSSETALLACY